MNQTEGLRARKKRRTAEQIESVALKLFGRNGFEATTIDAIAAGADIAPRTFFHYYPTKEDVVLADYSRRLQRLIVELTAQPHDAPPWTALSAALQVVAADFESEREQIVSRFQIIAAAPSVLARALQLQAECEDAACTVLAERLSDDENQDYTPRLLASAALAVMRTSLAHWVASGFNQPLPDIVQACFADLGRGLDQGRP